MNQVEFIEKIVRTPTAVSFRFKPEVPFIAGQYCRIMFEPEDNANRELNKFLSFSSAPEEGFIEFTKRITDSVFSQKLLSLKAGDKIQISEAKGHCFLKPENKKVLFLVGGIGVTPVASMLRAEAALKSQRDIILIYSNRNQEETPFSQELAQWESLMPNLKTIYTYSECDLKHHNCEFGFINEQMINKRVPDFHDRLVFVFGPPNMVNAVKAICCDNLKCDKTKLLFETFMGY